MGERFGPFDGFAIDAIPGFTEGGPATEVIVTFVGVDDTDDLVLALAPQEAYATGQALMAKALQAGADPFTELPPLED